MDIEIPIGAMDVRMNIQFNLLMCKERYESSTTTFLRSTRAIGVGGSRSKERDRKSEIVLRSTYQIF